MRNDSSYGDGTIRLARGGSGACQGRSQDYGTRQAQRGEDGRLFSGLIENGTALEANARRADDFLNRNWLEGGGAGFRALHDRREKVNAQEQNGCDSGQQHGPALHTSPRRQAIDSRSHYHGPRYNMQAKSLRGFASDRDPGDPGLSRGPILEPAF